MGHNLVILVCVKFVAGTESSPSIILPHVPSSASMVAGRHALSGNWLRRVREYLNYTRCTKHSASVVVGSVESESALTIPVVPSTPPQWWLAL